MKIPKTLGACADMVYSLKQKRLLIQHEVDELQAQETELRQHIIDTLPKSQASGVAGKLARVSVVTKVVPRVEDWRLFWSKFNPKRDSDLVQHRLSNEAVAARWENGEKVPGVETFTVVSLSINKL